MERTIFAIMEGVVDVTSYVHTLITRRGHAMHTIMDRFIRIMGPGRDSWDEPEATKRVCNTSIRHEDVY
jgi:hypothetical protein